MRPPPFSEDHGGASATVGHEGHLQLLDGDRRHAQHFLKPHGLR